MISRYFLQKIPRYPASVSQYEFSCIYSSKLPWKFRTIGSSEVNITDLLISNLSFIQLGSDDRLLIIRDRFHMSDDSPVWIVPKVLESSELGFLFTIEW